MMKIAYWIQMMLLAVIVGGIGLVTWLRSTLVFIDTLVSFSALCFWCVLLFFVYLEVEVRWVIFCGRVLSRRGVMSLPAHMQ